MTLPTDTQRILKIALASETAKADFVTELATITTATESVATDATTALTTLTALAALDTVVGADATDLASAIALTNEMKKRLALFLARTTSGAVLPFFQTFESVGYDPTTELTFGNYSTTPTVDTASVDADMPSSTKSLKCTLPSGFGSVRVADIQANPTVDQRATTWLQFSLAGTSLHQGFLAIGANDDNNNHIIGVVENVVGNERSWFVGRTLGGAFSVIDTDVISNTTLGDPIGLRLEVVDGGTYPHVKAWINLNGAGWTSVYDADDTGGATMLGDLKDPLIIQNPVIGDSGDLLYVGSLFVEAL